MHESSDALQSTRFTRRLVDDVVENPNGETL
jgi:hypothetical protein